MKQNNGRNTVFCSWNQKNCRDGVFAIMALNKPQGSRVRELPRTNEISGSRSRRARSYTCSEEKEGRKSWVTGRRGRGLFLSEQALRLSEETSPGQERLWVVGGEKTVLV